MSVYFMVSYNSLCISVSCTNIVVGLDHGKKKTQIDLAQPAYGEIDRAHDDVMIFNSALSVDPNNCNLSPGCKEDKEIRK